LTAKAAVGGPKCAEQRIGDGAQACVTGRASGATPTIPTPLVVAAMMPAIWVACDVVTGSRLPRRRGCAGYERESALKSHGATPICR